MARIKITSSAVNSTAIGSGKLGINRTSPIAEPNSSAMSVLMIASSDST